MRICCVDCERLDMTLQSRAETAVKDEQHPRGTLAIVAVFGLLFALGWLAMFLLVFLRRGAPQL